MKQEKCRVKRVKAEGFTLLELLAAVAILLVLALLIIPVSQSVLENSRAATCVTNLRTLAQASFAYATDNNGSLPDRGGWVHTSAKNSLAPYLGFPLNSSDSAWDETPGYAKLMTCPSIRASAEYRPVKGARSYSINQYATGSGVDEWETQVRARGVPLKVGNITQAASQSFFMDGPCMPSGDGVRYSTYQAPDRLAPLDGSGGWRTFYAHRDGINVVFLDGHTEMISQKQAEDELVGPTNPSSANASSSPRTKPFWGATK